MRSPEELLSEANMDLWLCWAAAAQANALEELQAAVDAVSALERKLRAAGGPGGAPWTPPEA